MGAALQRGRGDSKAGRDYERLDDRYHLSNVGIVEAIPDLDTAMRVDRSHHTARQSALSHLRLQSFETSSGTNASYRGSVLSGR